MIFYYLVIFVEIVLVLVMSRMAEEGWPWVLLGLMGHVPAAVVVVVVVVVAACYSATDYGSGFVDHGMMLMLLLLVEDLSFYE